jgi:hypothetical protein
MKKVCPVCKIEKPRTEFRVQSKMQNGKWYPYISACLPCERKRSREYGMRRRATDPEFAAKNLLNLKKLREREAANPQMRSEINRKYRSKPNQKTKKRAWFMAQYHQPKNQPCSVTECQRKAERHHPDYNKPKEVIWLCRKHHKEAHRAEVLHRS